MLSSNIKRKRRHTCYELLGFERHRYSFRVNTLTLATWELGNITKIVIKIPPIHTTVPITWMKWLNASIHRLILRLRSRSYANRSKGTGKFLYAPIPFDDATQCSTYLDFLVFFLPLAGFSLVCFSGMHPQPQLFFFSAIFITSFLFKQLSNDLNIKPRFSHVKFFGKIHKTLNWRVMHKYILAAILLK